MCGHTKRYNIRNEDICGSGLCAEQDAGNEAEMVLTCEEEMCSCPVRRFERVAVVGLRRGRGRPKKYWVEVIRKDMTHLQLTEDMTLDRRGMWRSSIRIEC